MRRKEAVKPVTQWTIIAASLMKALHIVLNRNTTETQQKSCDNKRQLCFHLKKKKKPSPSSNKWCKHTLKENNSKKKENFEENVQLFAFKTAAD